MPVRDEFVTVIGVKETDRDVYCLDCGQLRLWCKPGIPLTCGGCGSQNIKVGRVGDPELEKLRRPDGV